MKKKSTTIMPFDDNTDVSENETAATISDGSDSYTKAVDLNYRIKLSAQMAQQNLIEACKGLKEMKDTGLYSELGYGSFEEYTETEVGIKSRQAYRYISIIENLPEDFLSPGAKIGATKLYLLSTLSEEERTEVTETVDLENVTKRELEKKVKEIKTLRHDLEKAAEEKETSDKECEQLKMEIDTTSRENAKLQKRIEELESRPVDVAVEEKSNEEEIEKIRKQAEKEKSDIKAKYMAQIEEMTADYEKKLSEAESAAKPEVVADSKETFKMYYATAYNAFNSLAKFVKSADGEMKTIFVEKLIKLADSLKESVKDV